jgi:hypothetical protein
MPDRPCGPQGGKGTGRAERAENTMNTMGFCVATCLGAALVCGLGKLAVDLQKSQPTPRRKKPWEMI